MAMAAGSSSFVRTSGDRSARNAQAPGTRYGNHGQTFVSYGLQDLDQIIGGGIPLGSLTVIMEDSFMPLHNVLLRYFIAQGLAHCQPLLYASHHPSPHKFVQSVPSIVQPKKDEQEKVKEKEKEKEGDQGRDGEGTMQDRSSQGDGLRIAWQYRRFLNEQAALEDRRRRQQEESTAAAAGRGEGEGEGEGGARTHLAQQTLRNPTWLGPASSFAKMSASSAAKRRQGDPPAPYVHSFSLKKPIDNVLLSSKSNLECYTICMDEGLSGLYDRCREFVEKLGRLCRQQEGGPRQVGRLVLHSLGALYSEAHEWEILRFLHALKGLLRTWQNVAAIISFPRDIHCRMFCAKVQHCADTLLSIEGINEDDQELAGVFTDFQEVLAFFRIHKVPAINTQVAQLPETTTYAMKIVRRKKLVLERLHLAPADAGTGGLADGHQTQSASGSKSAARLLCGRPESSSPLDF